MFRKHLEKPVPADRNARFAQLAAQQVKQLAPSQTRLPAPLPPHQFKHETLVNLPPMP